LQHHLRLHLLIQRVRCELVSPRVWPLRHLHRRLLIQRVRCERVLTKRSQGTGLFRVLQQLLEQGIHCLCPRRLPCNKLQCLHKECQFPQAAPPAQLLPTASRRSPALMLPPPTSAPPALLPPPPSAAPMQTNRATPSGCHAPSSAECRPCDAPASDVCPANGPAAPATPARPGSGASTPTQTSAAPALLPPPPSVARFKFCPRRPRQMPVRAGHAVGPAAVGSAALPPPPQSATAPLCDARPASRLPRLPSAAHAPSVLPCGASGPGPGRQARLERPPQLRRPLLSLLPPPQRLSPLLLLLLSPAAPKGAAVEAERHQPPSAQQQQQDDGGAALPTGAVLQPVPSPPPPSPLVETSPTSLPLSGALPRTPASSSSSAASAARGRRQSAQSSNTRSTTCRASATWKPRLQQRLQQRRARRGGAGAPPGALPARPSRAGRGRRASRRPLARPQGVLDAVLGPRSSSRRNISVERRVGGAQAARTPSEGAPDGTPPEPARPQSPEKRSSPPGSEEASATPRPPFELRVQRAQRPIVPRTLTPMHAAEPAAGAGLAVSVLLQAAPAAAQEPPPAPVDSGAPAPQPEVPSHLALAFASRVAALEKEADAVVASSRSRPAGGPGYSGGATAAQLAGAGAPPREQQFRQALSPTAASTEAATPAASIGSSSPDTCRRRDTESAPGQRRQGHQCQPVGCDLVEAFAGDISRPAHPGPPQVRMARALLLAYTAPHRLRQATRRRGPGHWRRRLRVHLASERRSLRRQPRLSARINLGGRVRHSQAMMDMVAPVLSPRQTRVGDRQGARRVAAAAIMMTFKARKRTFYSLCARHLQRIARSLAGPVWPAVSLRPDCAVPGAPRHG